MPEVFEDKMAVLLRWGKTLLYTLFLIFRSSMTTSITQSTSLIFLISYHMYTDVSN